MSAATTISQGDSTNCNFSITNISPRIEPAEYLSSTLNTNTNRSSYRKSYIAWDKLERANKPDNYTEKTKYLSKNAKALLSVVYQKLKKQPLLLLTHKYISTITCSGSRQNQNVVRELAEILDISYHRSAEDHKGKKYEYVYKFIHKTNKKESREKNVIRKKISVSNVLATYIRENKIINNRSRTNFKKIFSDKEISNTQPNNKIGESGNKSSSDGINTTRAITEDISNISVTSFSGSIKKQEIATPVSNNSNGFLGSGKFLSQMLEHLTEDMCQLIRSNCGRDFTDRAIREIAKAVSKSKKGSKAFFYHIKGFIAYLSKILRFEKRDPEKISGNNYYIISNQSEEEQDIQKQEKYLSEIEYSLQVSPEWHLKKKLASVLERPKAYDILTSFQSLDIRKNKAVMILNKHVELSKNDKEIILSQIQATHEKTGEEGESQYIEFLEVEMPDKSISESTSASSMTFAPKQNFPKREGVWGKVREKFVSYFGSEGEDIDKAWTARLKAEVEENNHTINLLAPTPFVKDWINSNSSFDKIPPISQNRLIQNLIIYR